MKFCSKCGSQIPDDAQFCGECGAKIVEESLSQPTTTNSSPKVSPNGIVLESDAPIPNREITWQFQGWVVCIIVAVISVALSKIVAEGFILLIGVSIFGLNWVNDKHTESIKSHMYEMTETKYKFVYGVNYGDLYNKISPVLAAKYGSEMQFDRRDDAFLVKYKKFPFEVILQEDGTFVISFGTLWMAESTWYKRARTATAIIAYEIQKQFGVN